MRILFINYEFPPIGGGAGRVSANLASEITKLGHDVTVLTSAYADFPREERRDGYRIVRIPTWRRHADRCSIPEMVIFLLSSLVQAPKWVAQNRPDICLSFFTLPCAPAAYLLKRRFKIPYLISLQGGDVPGFHGGRVLDFFHAITKGITRFLWHHASARLANSRGLQALASRSDACSIEEIPNGVDPFFFLPDASRPLSSSPLHLISVGRLSAQKDLSTLLRAFARVNAEGILQIIGDGPERRALESLARELGIADRVSFLGWRTPEELKLLYARADLFVMSSIDEGMPIAVLEAMATGLPIVGTQVSGMDELVDEGQNGYTVPSRDVVALAAALSRAMASPEMLREMGRVSMAIAREYDWSAIAEKYLACCERIVVKV